MVANTIIGFAKPKGSSFSESEPMMDILRNLHVPGYSSIGFVTEIPKITFRAIGPKWKMPVFLHPSTGDRNT